MLLEDSYFFFLDRCLLIHQWFSSLGCCLVSKCNPSIAESTFFMIMVCCMDFILILVLGFIRFMGNPRRCDICLRVFCSSNCLCGIHGSWNTLLIRNLYAANLCSTEQLDLKCMAIDVWLLKITTIIIHIQLLFLIIVTLLLQSMTQTLLYISWPSTSLQMAEKGWNM
jgi:hypothetical protein